MILSEVQVNNLSKKKPIESLADTITQRENANRHTQRGMSLLEKSIEQRGWIGAITVAANGETFDGSARRETLETAGLDDAVIVRTNGRQPIIHVREDIATADDPRAIELSLAANRIASLNLEWEPAVLAAIAARGDVDVGGLFSSEEWKQASAPALPAPGGGGDEFDATPEQGETRTRLGELWSIGGKHRLLVGDCTVKENVDRLMGGERAALVFEDPPYNVAYQDNESIESLKARNRRTDGKIVENDAMTDEQFDAFLDAFIGALPLAPGGAYYLCAPAGHTETQFRNALNRVSGCALRQCIVWVKDRFVFGRQDYHWRHESILYGWREGAAHYFADDHTQDTVWEIDRPTDSPDHPTQKPLALPERAIGNSSKEGDIVFDGFLGSGTTLIAAHRTGRRCYGMEIAPRYADVIIKRAEAESLVCELQTYEPS